MLAVCLTYYKLQGIYKRSTCQTTSLLSETFLFDVRDACELQLVSYVSKHASRSLSDTTFCAYFKHESKPLAATTLAHTKRAEVQEESELTLPLVARYSRVREEALLLRLIDGMQG